jgi:hypothetical protein
MRVYSEPNTQDFALFQGAVFAPSTNAPLWHTSAGNDDDVKFGDLPMIFGGPDGPTGDPGLLGMTQPGETLSEFATRVGADPCDIIRFNPQFFKFPGCTVNPKFDQVKILFLQQPPSPPPVKTDTVQPGEGLWQFAERQLKNSGIDQPTPEQITVAQKAIARMNGYPNLTPTLRAGDRVKISGSEAVAAKMATDAGARLGYAFQQLPNGLGDEVVQALSGALPYIVSCAALIVGLLAFGPPGWASAIAFLGTLGLVLPSIKAVETFLFFVGAVAFADNQSQVDSIVAQYRGEAARDIINVALSLGGYGLSKGISALRTTLESAVEMNICPGCAARHRPST